MFTFNTGTKTFIVKFKHERVKRIEKQNKKVTIGKKEIIKEVKVPRATNCTIETLSVGQRRTIDICPENIVGKGRSKVEKELAVILDSDKALNTIKNRKIKRVVKSASGPKVAIINGDNFSYIEGRKLALRKAIDNYGKFSKETKKEIWRSFFGMSNIYFQETQED